ncbi:AMP-binding protein [Pseudonocardia sp. H11422]|uniref:AMP-binding protein n=1 Tax=Pseudonocardia sp. H11422 TaxID=2835866 RepID=UPI001BDD9ECE|nr:AMP-binding protein [Pseudonocardia sp. H11422]
MSEPLSESYFPADRTGEVRDVTVGQVVDEVAAVHPDRLALVYAEPPAAPRTWTYRELADEADRVARALLAEFTPGERVAVWSPNCAEWVLLQHGAARAGIVLVTVNPAYLERELRHVLARSEAVGVFYAPQFRGLDLGEVVARAIADLPAVRRTVSFAAWADFVTGADLDRVLPVVDPGGACQIQFTSGTTGAPKGAVLHHRGIVNAARFVAERVGLTDGAVSVNSMPLFHIGGCGVMELGTMAKAGTYVLAPGFDPGHVLELIEAHRGEVTLAVPTMLIALLEHPDLEKRDLGSLRVVMTGGASAPAELVRRTKCTLGTDFTISYGQTELCGVITQTAPADDEGDQAETIGRPLPFAEVKVIDPTEGVVLPVGRQGEICTRGYQTMLGYHGQAAETASTVDDDGWLHTGDLGTMDERGYLRITGRIKDMIVRGGEKVYPREIEEVLHTHPAVLDVAVLGVPDERWGERVVAAVRLRPGTDTDGIGPALTEHCRAQLARYKVPVEWHVLDQFPQTPSGKIQKFVLRDQLTHP